MAITANDIFLRKSFIMEDTDDGGGAPSANIVQDGLSNEIFPDISELDRTLGRVNLRKLFVCVNSNDTDHYYGANVIISDPPQDPNVSVTLFTDKEFFSNRQDAINRITSFLTKGVRKPGYLLENHIKGQVVIQFFHRPEDSLPNIGETVALVYNEGGSTALEQYVRIVGISSEVRTFTDEKGDYKARVTAITISDPLLYDFPGGGPSRTFYNPSVTNMRECVVADAGKYAGVSKLVKPASVGDLSLKVASIYSQLVPSAQTETPIIDYSPHSSFYKYLSTYTVSFSRYLQVKSGSVFVFGMPIKPGSFKMTLGSVEFTDLGGVIYEGSVDVGYISYETGTVGFSQVTTRTGTWQIEYVAAGLRQLAPKSSSWAVTASNRSESLVGYFVTIPQPGSLEIHYRAQGNWYVLKDRGDGHLKGADDSWGSGYINYNTGSFYATFGALPDVNTKIIAYWTTKSVERQVTLDVKAYCEFQLSHTGITPGTLNISWGTNSTAQDDGHGSIIGDATGKIDYNTGKITFIPTIMPPKDSEITFSYQYGDPIQENFEHPVRNTNGELSLILSHQNIIPGTIKVQWNTEIEINGPTKSFWQLIYRPEPPRPPSRDPWRIDPIVTAFDSGNGTLITADGQTISSSISYTDGILTFIPDVEVSLPTPNYSYTQIGTRTDSATGNIYALMKREVSGYTYYEHPAMYPPGESGWVKVWYRSTTSSTQASDTFVFVPHIDLTPGYGEIVIPSSIYMEYAGKVWKDKLTGGIYFDIDWLTGAGTEGGNIDYSSGVVTLTQWPVGANNSGSATVWVSSGDELVDHISFRTPLAPIKPGSLTIRYQIAGENAARVVSADDSGVISDDYVQGSIDYETGICVINFGFKMTLQDAQESGWYEEGMEVDQDNKVWNPVWCLASTIRYACVGYTYTPVDSTILGINPVRLPPNGKVPIFKAGDVIVIGKTNVIDNITVQDSQVVSTGYTRLSRIKIYDKNGVAITTGYNADLESGVITFIDTSSYEQPISIHCRYEDMALVTDVQISGDISIARPISHDYPVGSYVSSAIVIGDMWARVTNIFDQASWDNQWLDYVNGSPATASYDYVNYPIEVTNDGAVTERWCIRFTTSTTFDVIGEHVGVIASGNTGVVCSPINPATNKPYFVIRPEGWGSGWSAGNVLRFNTIGAMFPIWVVRTIQMGEPTYESDKFCILIRGDVNREV